jgi:hypothetical protein
VRHWLPAELPEVVNVAAARAGTFQVTPAENAAFGAVLAELLAEHLARQPFGAAAGGEPVTAVIDGACDIRVEDKAGKRKLRRWRPEAAGLEVVEVDTLTRTAHVRVDFHIRDARTGRQIACIETHQAYHSGADPRSTGELGLTRPDDPSPLPGGDTVVGELLAACVGALVKMIRPVEIEHTVELRSPLLGGLGEANRAAAAGKYARAAELYRSCLQSQSDSADLWFNLGAVEEAGGQLDAARQHYRKAAELAKRPDAAALAGAERVRRVLAQREYAGLTTAGTAPAGS